jgi:phosphatidylcholine synthase
MARPQRIARLLSWSIHLFTASGAVLGLFALVSTAQERLDRAALLILAAFLIDAVDGTFARAAKVTEHLPFFDGRRLDDTVDFLNYTIVPAFFMWGAGILVHPLWLAAPVLASAYGFSRIDAKTEDDFFLGFPSYWNIVALYLWLLEIGPVASTGWIAALSIAVFVPVKYLYPSKVEPLSLRRALAIGGLAWLLALVACIVWPQMARDLLLPELSLGYPVWYLWLSFSRGGLARDVEL